MKLKIVSVALVVFLALGMFLAIQGPAALAQTIPSTVPSSAVEIDQWVLTPATPAGTAIAFSKVKPVFLPSAQLQLFSTGLTITQAAKICYPFRGGQFGWRGTIRMLSNNAWAPIATKVVWLPTIEGRLWACADAPSAGTYALFAYWKPLQ
jgi:hypothetical protein